MKQPKERKENNSDKTDSDQMNILNTVVLGIVNKLNYTIELTPPKHVSHSMFYSVSFIQKYGSTFYAYDSEIKQYELTHYLNELKLGTRQFQRRYINDMKYIQISSFLDIIEMETFYKFNRKYSKTNPAQFEILSISSPTNTMTIDEFIEIEKDQNFITMIEKRIKKETKNLKITNVNEMKKYQLKKEKQDEKEKDEQMVNEWNWCLIYIVETLGYQIEFIELNGNNSFAFIRSIKKDEKENVINATVNRRKTNEVKFQQLKKMISIINIESDYTVVCYDQSIVNDEEKDWSIPRYVKPKTGTLSKRAKLLPNQILKMLKDEMISMF